MRHRRLLALEVESKMVPEPNKVSVLVVNQVVSAGSDLEQQEKQRKHLITRSVGVASVLCVCALPCSDSFVGLTSPTTRSPLASKSQASTGLRGSAPLSSFSKSVAAAAADSETGAGAHGYNHSHIGLGATVAAGSAVAMRRRRRQHTGRQASTAPIPISTAPVPTAPMPTATIEPEMSSTRADVPQVVDTTLLYNVMYDRTSSVGQTLSGQSVPYLDVLLSQYTVVPALAAVGAVACPSQARLVQVFAAGLAGIAGTYATPFLRKGKKDGARAAVLRVLAENFHTAVPVDALKSMVDAERQRFGVAADQKFGEEFEDKELEEMYASLLIELLNGPEHCPTDLPMLQRLRAVLNLDGIVVGTAHKRAAQVLVSKGYSGVDGDELRVAVDKFLFLSDRAFSDEQPEEFRLFEMSRIRKILKMPPAEAKERTTVVSRALYQQSLTSVVDHVDSSVAEVLSQASSSFGMEDEDTAKMNTASYITITTTLLESGSIDEAGRATLARAREVLQLGERTASAAFNGVAGPILAKDVQSVVDDWRATDVAATSEQVSSAASKLKQRAKEVGIDAGAADSVFAEGFLDGIRKIYSKACKDARVSISGEERALATCDQLLAFAPSVDAVLTNLRSAKSSDADKDTAHAVPLSIPADTTSAGKLYGFYFARAMTGDAPESVPAPAELARILQLSDEEGEAARVEVCEPRLKKLYTESIDKAAAGKIPLAMSKMAVGPELTMYNLPADCIEETAISVYRARLDLMRGRLLTAEEKDQLDAERSFLDLSEDQVRRLHLKAFGRPYENSVQEAMGADEAMLPATKEGLDTMRARLGLAAADGVAIFNGVADSRLKELMADAKDAWEDATLSKDKLKKAREARGEDVGDAPLADGTGGNLGLRDDVPLENARGSEFMFEASKVVDFYVGNQVFKGGTPGEEDNYPVVVGKYLEDDKKEEMYGMFAWNSITCQDPGIKDNWETVRPHFGGILGVTQNQQDKVVQRMVARWCGTYISQKTKEKGALDEKDLDTLNNWVPTYFKLEKSVAKAIVKNANQGMLQGRVLQLMNLQKITPEDVARLREDVALWGLRLEKDFELTRPNLRSLYRIEVMAAIEDVSKNDEQKRKAVAESQDAFGLEELEAKKELGDLLNTRCKGCLINAVGDMMQGNEEHAAKEMQRLEFLAAFAKGVDDMELSQDWEVAVTMRKQLVKIYKEGAAKAGGREPDIKFLDEVLGISA